MYEALADLTLALHVGVVLFVVGGLLLVVFGNLAGWRWVNSLVFRLAHLAAIGTVVAQAWLGIVCPLTTLESWLRVQGGGVVYETSFIQHWVHYFLFYEAPGWVFAAVYSAFALLVVGSWIIYPPRFAWRRRPGDVAES